MLTKLKYGTLAWVWLALIVADVAWEATGFFVHGTGWDHLTLSQIVKRWEGIDPVTGEPTSTPVGLVKRAAVGLVVVVAGVALILHWVFQVF